MTKSNSEPRADKKPAIADKPKSPAVRDHRRSSQLLLVKTPEELTRRQKATERLLGYSKHTKRLVYREHPASGQAIGCGVLEGRANSGENWS